MPLKLYTLATCSTCRRATKWLRDHGITFQERPIRETPPSMPELRAMLTSNGGELRRLFNTSGRDYREQHLGEKLGTMSVEAALELLNRNGNLVRRPFLIGDAIAQVGFDEAEYRAALRAEL